jgi:hypothetical protein
MENGTSQGKEKPVPFRFPRPGNALSLGLQEEEENADGKAFPRLGIQGQIGIVEHLVLEVGAYQLVHLGRDLVGPTLVDMVAPKRSLRSWTVPPPNRRFR